MIEVALIVEMVTAILETSPALTGLATWYGVGDGSGAVFRNGDPFALDAPYCAVDASEWAWMRGRGLFILSESGKWRILQVADSGHLYRAGPFWRSKYSEVYFTPAEADGEGPALQVAVDIPLKTFESIFGTTETQRVWAWVLE